MPFAIIKTQNVIVIVIVIVNIPQCSWLNHPWPLLQKEGSLEGSLEGSSTALKKKTLRLCVSVYR
jgi:hypothetical protein